MFYFADKQANAIEYFFDKAESPREVKTQGLLVPTTIAANSP
jgi:hypothetical protein